MMRTLFTIFSMLLVSAVFAQDASKTSDTLIVFDPISMTESVKVIHFEKDENVHQKEVEKESLEKNIQVDTVITFDPVTKEETIKIIKRSKGN